MRCSRVLVLNLLWQDPPVLRTGQDTCALDNAFALIEGHPAPEVADILAAIDLYRLHGFSFWDALILRAAKQAGCSVLFSEDMQGTREIEGVRVVDPFALQN